MWGDSIFDGQGLLRKQNGSPPPHDGYGPKWSPESCHSYGCLFKKGWPMHTYTDRALIRCVDDLHKIPCGLWPVLAIFFSGPIDGGPYIHLIKRFF